MSQDKSDRQQRLAQALRDNLRRRKGQARDWAREEQPPDSRAADEESPPSH